jgi:hypothetical protein
MLVRDGRHRHAGLQGLFENLRLLSRHPIAPPFDRPAGPQLFRANLYKDAAFSQPGVASYSRPVWPRSERDNRSHND